MSEQTNNFKAEATDRVSVTSKRGELAGTVYGVYKFGSRVVYVVDLDEGRSVEVPGSKIRALDIDEDPRDTAAMVDCPKCKGSGRLPVTVTEAGVTRKLDLGCVYCHEVGKLTPEALEALKAEDAMWCQCGKSKAPIFFDDGEHPEIHKHHYRCEFCDHVVQIG